MEEFNINEVIGSFLSHKAEDITLVAKKGIKKFSNELDLKLKSRYKKYLQNITGRYGKTRSFFIREEPKPLYQFYEPIGIQSETLKFEKAYLNDVVVANNKILILGSGGAGKSILLKHFLLDSLKTNYKVPIFIELRDSNQKDLSLIELVAKALKDFDLDVDDNYLNRALEEGHFIIFLDGLDEVKNSLRTSIITDIEEFSGKYDGCTFIVSSRPDDEISEFEQYTFFQTLPLTLEQSISLVNKLPAEDEIKSKFIYDLGTGLFEKHSSFLSNPLLLSIMLLTYGFSADIPNKLSIFYNQAFEALFQRHDALKGAYKRDRKSKLDIVSFERVLTAFCILTYDQRKFQFSRVEAQHFLNKGAALVGIEINSDHVLDDLMQAVCFLIQDGLFLTFTHRSFQEYFTAKFIANTNEKDVKKKLLEKFYRDLWRDNIYNLVYELDTAFFEKDILIPFLEDLFEKIGLKKNVNKTNYLKFSKLLYSRIEAEPQRSGLIGVIRDSKAFHLADIVTYEVPSINSVKPLGEFSDRSLEKDFIEECKSKGLERKIFKFSTLKTADPIFQKLYEGDSYYSPRRLRYIHDIYKFLINKHKVMAADLENLISQTDPNKH